MNTTAVLVTILKQHSVEVLSHTDAKIVVNTLYTRNGEAILEKEEVEPTLEAVRNYLGY